MANITTYLSFTGPINLPNVDVYTQATLTACIDVHEPEYLQKAMGYVFYKLFNDNIASADARWVALRNGSTYTDCNGITQKWEGFTVVGKSPIAYFIYYWYRRENDTYTSQAGEKKGKTSNAVDTTGYVKMCNAWASMSDMTKNLWGFLTHSLNGDNTRMFPEFDICNINTRSFDKISQLL